MQLDKIERPKLNFSSFIQKGIYIDNAKNRKLGRVGMTYGGKKDEKKNSNEDSSIKLKKKQLEICLKYNPMHDDIHTGIRKIEDIKTLDELLPNGEDEFVYPDFTEKDAKKAKEKGKLIVYSSYPIKQGTFISPSRMCALDYSGGGKIYAKEISLEDIAWIDGGQGQYTNLKKN